jgi:hypothetical protein
MCEKTHYSARLLLIHALSITIENGGKPVPITPMKISRILLVAIYLAGLASVFGQTKVAPKIKRLTSLKNIEGIRFAADFAAGSTTCGITEAIAALPFSGGKVVLQQGNCSASGWPVTIQKPVVIEGQGMGGPTDPGTNANIMAGSSLTNTSTGSSFFVISLGARASLEGVTFRDFAMMGNKAVGGATAGDCVDINGGTTAQQVRALSFENIHCNQPKGSGFVIKDNAFMINFLTVHVNQSGSHCYVLKDGVSSGVNSQIHFLQSTGDLCGGSTASFNPGVADGWNISGLTSRTVDIVASTLADSNNGINVVVGATNSNIHVTNSDLETNTTCDINLNDGFGHVIMGSTLFGTGTGARGICTAMPVGASSQVIQLLLWANNFASHTVQDVTIGATQKTCSIFPEATNIYTYTDNSGHCIKQDVDVNGSLIISTASTGGILPTSNGTGNIGQSSQAWANMYRFTDRIVELTAPSAATGQEVCYGDSTAHALQCSYNNGSFLKIPQVVASGTSTFTTTAITAGTCQLTVTTPATGAATTDGIEVAYASAPTGTTDGLLILNKWVTSGSVNFSRCNPTARSITPTALVLNWRVIR